MTAAVGHPTLRLVRVSIGSFHLGALPPGQWRDVSLAERQQIFASIGSSRGPGK
jgi:23S rRNA pseudouridine2457 synthase